MLLTMCLFASSLIPIKSQMSGHIVGGVKTESNLFPYSVYLNIRCGAIFICGSSIINQRILLTAAHCFYDCVNKKNNTKAIAFAGNGYWKNSTAVREVIKYILHEGYNNVTVANDIGLAGLNKALPYGDNIKKVIVPRRFPDVTYGHVAGWGDTEKKANPSASINLKYMNHYIIKDVSFCRELQEIPKGIICCASKTGVADQPSHGDSGGGLVTTDHAVIGIVSFGYGYTKKTFYTNTTCFYNWIKRNSKKLYCMM